MDPKTQLAFRFSDYSICIHGYVYDKWSDFAFQRLNHSAANPSLAAIFPTHHGLIHIHTLPAPHTILPPSDKFSALRGLSSSAVSIGGSGENNLAFKCMRKRLIFETLHLDLEGGIGERRTTPSTNAMALDAGTTLHDLEHDHTHTQRNTDLASVLVEVETVASTVAATDGGELKGSPVGAGAKAKKPKKKVAFHSDRPDLYDF